MPRSLAAEAHASPSGRTPPPQADDGLGRTSARPARELDPGALRAVWMDLVGRPPFLAERREWSGRARHELVDGLLASEAAWEHWYEEQLYYFLLIDNFRPETERARSIPADLAAGRIDPRQAVHRIALSASFDQRNPGADTFVTVVMEQLTGLTVQKNSGDLEIGKAVYDGSEGLFLGKPGKTQADIVRIAVEHKRFAQQFVEREYRRVLRREPDRKALAGWTRAFHRDPRTFASILREWMLSAEYDERLAERQPMPNRFFVRALFVDLLDRAPEPEEARRLRTALDGLSDPGPLRSVVARLLIDSGEALFPDKETIEDPTSWVRDLFRRYLGREPLDAELAVFVRSFHDEACRPSTVVYAILSHPEYHAY